MTENIRPSVTFALSAYNQQNYIEEAVTAAFAQTYSPLEIIVSDDLSTDKTFDIMTRLVSSYEGPHRVVLNRNSSNLGIAGHINSLLDRATGELIVLAAGDDVSEVDRTAEIVKHWVSRNKTLDVMWSNAALIDEHGKLTGELRSQVSSEPIEAQIQQMVPSLIGCSYAITKRLYRQYGPLPERITYEDRAFAFRGLCAGGLGSIDKSLVRYRVHDKSLSASLKVPHWGRNADERLRNRRLDFKRRSAVFAGYQEDVRKISSKGVSGVSVARIDTTVRIAAKTNAIEILIHSDKFADRLFGLCKGFFRSGTSMRRRFRYLVCSISPRVWFCFVR